MLTTDHLLAAILHAPDDDAPRLIYADWLDERGEWERAEFVRVQVELVRQPANPRCHCLGGCLMNHAGCPLAIKEKLQKRERELWMRIAAAEPIGKVCDRKHWSRGFVSRIELTTDAFLDHAADLFARHPITSMRLVDREPYKLAAISGRWAWDYQGEDAGGRHTLPKAIHDCVQGERHPNGLILFSSPVLAHAALDRACVSFGRGLVGLPPLTMEG